MTGDWTMQGCQAQQAEGTQSQSPNLGGKRSFSELPDPKMKNEVVNSNLPLNFRFWKREFEFEFCTCCVIIFPDSQGLSQYQKHVHDMEAGC